MKLNIVYTVHDPRLIDVAASIKELQKQLDDAVWEHGYKDEHKTIEDEINRLKNLEKDGVIIEPTF